MTDADLARVRWRSRRGLLELDILLRRFVDRHYGELTDAERRTFERLLGLADAELLRLLQGDAEFASDTIDRELITFAAAVRRHAYPDT